MTNQEPQLGRRIGIIFNISSAPKSARFENSTLASSFRVVKISPFAGARMMRHLLKWDF
jgi:hypothetical protein